jgi:NAD+ synthetase
MIADAYRSAVDAGADVCVTGELSVCGYPPDDLLGYSGFVERCEHAARSLCATTAGTALVVGTPVRVPATASIDSVQRCAANAALVARSGTVLVERHKVRLPTYGPFDESRWFHPGPVTSPTFALNASLADGRTIRVDAAVVICEDLWDLPTVTALAAGADLVIALNASPFEIGKHQRRVEIARAAAAALDATVLWVNSYGAQDELVFDGSSFAVDAGGWIHQLDRFRSGLSVIDVPVTVDGLDHPVPSCEVPSHPCELDTETEAWSAVSLAVRDYVDKLGVRDVLIGMSGGLDSAVVAALAVDALGSQRVRGVTMPGPHSSELSARLAVEQAEMLGIEVLTLPIIDTYATVCEQLDDTLAGGDPVAYENIQARLRALTLMALANSTGAMVLATGNKSELAVGYATLGGDLMGGFAPLRDLPKTLVRRLARWRNSCGGPTGHGPVIPIGVIERPPSAELAAGQSDEAALGDYDTLDAVLSAYVDHGSSPHGIGAALGDPAYVARICAMVDRAEFKRRQAPIGPKVTSRSFGRDRRIPIVSRPWPRA